MTKEFLTKLGISEENASQILAENKKDCDGVSAKFGDYEDVKSQLSAANKQIEEFGKLDYEGLKKTADDYKEKLAAAQKESAAKLEKMQFDHILEGKLSERKPRNAKAVKALLDMEGLKLSNGEIVGLTEQLDKIAKENDFLFESSEPVPRYTGPAAGSGNAPVADANSARAVMGLPPIK